MPPSLRRCPPRLLATPLKMEQPVGYPPPSWELEFLAEFCQSSACLEMIGYAKGSVLAGSWYVVQQSRLGLPLCGDSLEEESVIREWLEFYCNRLRPLSPWEHLSHEKLLSAIEELNSVLSDRIFLLSSSAITLADIILYYGLHRHLVEMTPSMKIKFVHVCRWIDQVQHYPNIKPLTWDWIMFPKHIGLLK